MLKGLIQLGKALEGKQAKYPTHHKIRDLWNDCKPMIERALPDGDAAALQAMDDCIREMARMDPEAEAFRYPENKKGQATEHTVTFLGLRNVKNVMNKIAAFLDGSYDCMCEELQCRSEELQRDDG
jgi:hypothetical protein